jgi:hypothetical protein
LICGRGVGGFTAGAPPPEEPPPVGGLGAGAGGLGAGVGGLTAGAPPPEEPPEIVGRGGCGCGLGPGEAGTVATPPPGFGTGAGLVITGRVASVGTCGPGRGRAGSVPTGADGRGLAAEPPVAPPLPGKGIGWVGLGAGALPTAGLGGPPGMPAAGLGTGGGSRLGRPVTGCPAGPVPVPPAPAAPALTVGMGLATMGVLGSSAVTGLVGAANRGVGRGPPAGAVAAGTPFGTLPMSLAAVARSISTRC